MQKEVLVISKTLSWSIDSLLNYTVMGLKQDIPSLATVKVLSVQASCKKRSDDAGHQPGGPSRYVQKTF